MVTLSRAFVAFALMAAVGTATAQELKIGDPAPPITVDKWLKGEPIEGFKPGEVYVVEFWATWCGPCKDSIPHLTELQKKYKDKVNVIGVSIWENKPEDIEPFVTTMGDLMDYRVAKDKISDPEEPVHGFMSQKWMEASGQEGIPTAFIIDREGKIAWIGHPMEMDEPLEKVIAGTFDVAEEKKAQAKNAEIEAKREQIIERYRQALEAGDWDNALKAADEATGEDLAPMGQLMKMTVYVQTRDFNNALVISDELMKMKGHEQMGAAIKWEVLFEHQKDYDRAYAFAKEAIEGPFKNDWSNLNQIAWAIVDPDATPEKQDLDLALKAAEMSVKLDRNHYNVDTLARVHWVKGDKKKAIELQKEAVKLAPPEEKAEMEATLKTYEEGAA